MTSCLELLLPYTPPIPLVTTMIKSIESTLASDFTVIDMIAPAYCGWKKSCWDSYETL